MFFVPGTPQSKGSRVQIRPGVNIEMGTNKSRKRKATWAKSVEDAARSAANGSSCALNRARRSPMALEVTFYLPIAKTRSSGKRMLIPNSEHTQVPDLDKLLRAIFDPIKKAEVVWDDCVIWHVMARKFWCEPEDAGADITLSWS